MSNGLMMHFILKNAVRSLYFYLEDPFGAHFITGATYEEF